MGQGFGVPETAGSVLRGLYEGSAVACDFIINE